MMEYTAQVILLLPVKRTPIKLHNCLPAVSSAHSLGYLVRAPS